MRKQPHSKQTAIDTLERRSYTDPVTGCRIWTGSLSHGYGQIGFAKRIYKTHRLAWESKYGPIPDGLGVLHHCDNRPCINPEHLFLGTNADNIRDMCSKGRMAHGSTHSSRTRPESVCRGTAHGRAKLDDAKVIAIFFDTRPMRVIAKEYGVCVMTVNLIKLGKTWRHLNLLRLAGQEMPQRDLPETGLSRSTQKSCLDQNRADET